MGRKLERYKRKQEREQHKIKAIERSLGINMPPKKCPYCNTEMVFQKIPKPNMRGVLNEGQYGGVAVPSPISSLDQAQNTPVYYCPNCGYSTPS